MISKYCQAIREKYCGVACTLDGHAAKVTGRALLFASVAPLDVTIGAVEFSWQVVARVMDGSRGFKS